jgi:hypothetical protein
MQLEAIVRVPLEESALTVQRHQLQGREEEKRGTHPASLMSLPSPHLSCALIWRGFAKCRSVERVSCGTTRKHD